MDKKTLRLLILEDNPDDAELEILELKREGFALKWNVVDTEQDFRKALAERPDLILADYKVPSFGGMAALQMKQKIAPDIPLIIISGTIGEEMAVECMKAGATDYVLKDRLSRLGPVVKRALEEAEVYRQRKQAEENLRKLNEELEERVKQRTAELEIVNKDLNDFAYVVSHDLKAPLRAVSQLSSWISRDYNDVLDENGKEQLSLLAGRVKRMDSLINGILQYSRIGRIKKKDRQVDLNVLVKDVIDVIAPPDHIHITINNRLPAILCDMTRMEQLFQNLIGNAVKFIDKPKGEIEIGCIDEETQWKFHISDNGTGIDEKYHDKIFQIFQTLNTDDDQENTGIGLSLVRKIVELYGGEVWLESKLGEGSVFFFTLQKGLKNETE